MPNEGCSIFCVTCIFSMQSDCELAVKIYISVTFVILLSAHCSRYWIEISVNWLHMLDTRWTCCWKPFQKTTLSNSFMHQATGLLNLKPLKLQWYKSS